MATIEVDFEVYKQLTVRRATEDTTYNDVLRELLGLKPENLDSRKVGDIPSPEDWIVKGVRFPVGTEFRANYKGKVYMGRAEGAAFVLSGQRYLSPSPAAVSITGHGINGWDFWECRLPGKSSWQYMNVLRSSNSL